MNELRAVVVGCGLMGRWHAYYAARAGARIVAFVDPRAQGAEALCGSHRNAQPYAALDTCLEQTRPDVVHVCTPAGSHAELVAQALAAGAHVLCEKPLASDARTTRALLDQARDVGRHLLPTHQFPFQPGMQTLVASRAQFGRLTEVHFRTFTAGAEGVEGRARMDVLLEILPHASSLFAALGFRGVPAEAFAVQRFDEDVLAIAGQVEATTLAVTIDSRARPTRNELLIAGSGASASADLFHGYATIDSAQVSRLSKVLRPLRVAARELGASSTNLATRALQRRPAYPGLFELIREFYARADAGDAPAIDPAEAIEAAALVDLLRAHADTTRAS